MRKVISFSPKLYSTAKVKAALLGVGFAEYVRHLVVVDTNGTSSQQTEQLTSLRLGKSYRRKYNSTELNEDAGEHELIGPFSEEELDLMD